MKEEVVAQTCYLQDALVPAGQPTRMRSESLASDNCNSKVNAI